jgi:transglutaminase-like putative cysteine protease
MVRLNVRIALAYQVQAPGADFIFNIQAAYTPLQKVVTEQLVISPMRDCEQGIDSVTQNRSLRLHAAAGPLLVTYSATVDLYHALALTTELQEIPVAQLPLEVLPYLYPSRYCQSDVLGSMVMGLFGAQPPGYARVMAVQAWVQAHVTFKSNTSNSATSALDTLRDRVGVCRDFAHLMIALCRALNMPARFSTGTDFGADPALGPPDFHAYVEVYLSHRWYIFDPSGTAIPLGFIRIGTGRDAADVSIATIFGAVQAEQPVISVSADPGTHGQYMVPAPSIYGISTA